MEGTASLIGCFLRFSVLPSSTAVDWDGARFEQPTILSIDDRLCSLSYRHKDDWSTQPAVCCNSFSTSSGILLTSTKSDWTESDHCNSHQDLTCNCIRSSASIRVSGGRMWLHIPLRREGFFSPLPGTEIMFSNRCCKEADHGSNAVQ